ncbi:MAG: translation initiation factor IF-2 [Candidatus Anammoxibacter sp.]
MDKTRISVLAKELGIKSNCLIEKCREKGFSKIHHHANTLDNKQVELIKLEYNKTGKVEKAKVKPDKQINDTKTPGKSAPEKPTPEKPKPIKSESEKPESAKAVVSTDDKNKKDPKADKNEKPQGAKRFIKIFQKGNNRFRTPLKSGAANKDKPQKQSVESAGDKSTSDSTLEDDNKDIVKEKELKIQVDYPVTVKELGNRLGIKSNNIITKLLIDHTIRATVNQNLDRDIVELLGLDFGYEIELKDGKRIEEEFILQETEGNPEDFVPRTPIVAFLGHVDHGKTSLLDSIRQTNVATGEAGGITQHMGAYHVETNGKRVIFLDTPGHEAFTSMRARGADVTDVVVLVVAADDGVMPQTEEALDHAKAANVSIMVAINKVDKPDANVLKVKQQLASLGLNPEEWGGKTQIVETSATTKQGLDELVEKLLLEAEVLDLKYNPKAPASGVILEAQIHAGKGVMANVIIRNGILRRGDVIFCGNTYGKVRSMYTDMGDATKSGGPEAPLLISDFSEVPEAGDRFYVVDDIVKAKEIAIARQDRFRESGQVGRSHVTLDNLFTKIAEGNVKEIRVILKADFKGSAEVLKKTVEGLSIGEINIRALHVGVGNITESDVLLADASDAIVIGFCVSTDDKAKTLSGEKGVEVRLYKVIYDVTKDVRAAMEGMLEPEKRDHVIGHVLIQKVFKISRYGNIAGCLVKDGKITRNSLVRLIRDDVVLHSGKLESLRTAKDAAKEVKTGFECGIRISGYDDIHVDDVIEAYEIQSIARFLS